MPVLSANVANQAHQKAYAKSTSCTPSLSETYVQRTLNIGCKHLLFQRTLKTTFVSTYVEIILELHG